MLTFANSTEQNTVKSEPEQCDKKKETQKRNKNIQIKKGRIYIISIYRQHDLLHRKS